MIWAFSFWSPSGIQNFTKLFRGPLSTCPQNFIAICSALFEQSCCQADSGCKDQEERSEQTPGLGWLLSVSTPPNITFHKDFSADAPATLTEDD